MSAPNPWKKVGDVFLKLINRASRHPERMSEAEWVIFRVWMLMGEVSNGGFDQYFSNSSGNHAARTVEALKAIGDTKGVAVLRKAMAVFPDPPSVDREQRSWQLSALTKARRGKFDALDREFWDCDREVVEKLAAYLDANRKSIHPKKERGDRRYE